MLVSTRTTRTDSTMLVSTRTTRTTLQLIDWAPVSLIRCIFPLDSILCRLDNACVHSYNLYDSSIRNDGTSIFADFADPQKSFRQILLHMSSAHASNPSAHVFCTCVKSFCTCLLHMRQILLHMSSAHASNPSAHVFCACLLRMRNITHSVTHNIAHNITHSVTHNITHRVAHSVALIKKRDTFLRCVWDSKQSTKVLPQHFPD